MRTDVRDCHTQHIIANAVFGAVSTHKKPCILHSVSRLKHNPEFLCAQSHDIFGRPTPGIRAGEIDQVHLQHVAIDVHANVYEAGAFHRDRQLSAMGPTHSISKQAGQVGVILIPDCVIDVPREVDDPALLLLARKHHRARNLR